MCFSRITSNHWFAAGLIAVKPVTEFLSEKIGCPLTVTSHTIPLIAGYAATVAIEKIKDTYSSLLNSGTHVDKLKNAVSNLIVGGIAGTISYYFTRVVYANNAQFDNNSGYPLVQVGVAAALSRYFQIESFIVDSIENSEDCDALLAHADLETKKTSAKAFIRTAVATGLALTMTNITDYIDTSKIVTMAGLLALSSFAYALNENHPKAFCKGLKEKVTKCITTPKTLYHGLKLGAETAVPALAYAFLTSNNWISEASLAALLHVMIWKAVQSYAHDYFTNHRTIREKHTQDFNPLPSNNNALQSKLKKHDTYVAPTTWIFPVKEAKIITAAIITLAVHTLTSGLIPSGSSLPLTNSSNLNSTLAAIPYESNSTLGWLFEPTIVIALSSLISKGINSLEKRASEAWNDFHKKHFTNISSLTKRI